MDTFAAVPFTVAPGLVVRVASFGIDVKVDYAKLLLVNAHDAETHPTAVDYFLAKQAEEKKI